MVRSFDMCAMCISTYRGKSKNPDTHFRVGTPRGHTLHASAGEGLRLRVCRCVSTTYSPVSLFYPICTRTCALYSCSSCANKERENQKLTVLPLSNRVHALAHGTRVDRSCCVGSEVRIFEAAAGVVASACPPPPRMSAWPPQILSMCSDRRAGWH